MVVKRLVELSVCFDQIQNMMIGAQQRRDEGEAGRAFVVLWNDSDVGQWNARLVRAQVFVNFLVENVKILCKSHKLQLLVFHRHSPVRRAVR